MSALHVLDALASAQPAPTTPPTWRWLTKWGYFIGLAALIGAPLVHLVVVRPALQAHADGPTGERGRRAMHRIIGLGAVGFAFVYVFQLVSVTARGLELDYAQALSPVVVWRYLTQPAEDGAWLGPGVTTSAQAGLAVAAVALLVPLARRAPARRGDRLVMVAAPIALAVTLVKSVPVAPDVLAAEELVGRVLVQVHIVGGSVWVGGLIALAALTHSRRHIRNADVDVWSTIWQRFSVLAMAAVAAILVSGAWLTWQEVGAVEQFVTTPFGRLLAVKIVLVAALIGFGAFNQLVLMPRLVHLRRSGQLEPARHLGIGHLGRIVLAESVIGLLVLLIVGLLTGSARAQADGSEAVVDASVYGWGAAFLVAVVALFAVTARVAAFLAERPSATAST